MKGFQEIINDKWGFFESVMEKVIPSEANFILNLVDTNDLLVIKDYIYPDAKTQLRPGKGKKGVKMPGGPQYIVIHDTGMPGTGDNAYGLNKYIHKQASINGGRVASWHFSVDDHEIYQHVPTDEVAWHAGDGHRRFGEKVLNKMTNKYDIGGGNLNGIGIETCINPTNDYELTLKKVAKLVAILLRKYNLGLERIKQHYDFSSKNCPNIIRSTKGLWESFLEDCRLQYLLLPLGVKMKWEIDKPEVIKQSGKIITPIHDTNVLITLHATIDNVTKTYQYHVLVRGLSNDDKLIKSYYQLYLNTPKIVKTNINLPKRLVKYKTLVEWKSSHPDIISANGIYRKPDNKTLVKLTATIKLGEKKLIKDINIFVV